MTPSTDQLARERTFRSLFEPEAWQRLIAEGEEVELPAGAVLMHRGEAAPHLVVIDEGTVEVVDARSSPETVLQVLGPGHVVGDMSFVDRAPATAEVRAHTHVRCHRWQPEALVALLQDRPDLSLTFYQALAVTVVARARTVLSAAIDGGFGAAGQRRERADALEVDRVADSLSIELLDPLAGAGAGADAERSIEAADALVSICRWFTAAGETARAVEVGARLRELLGEVLGSSATATAMLSRHEGSPAGPALFRHVLLGEAEGRDPAGQLLDGALLQLPTFRGWRWRDRALASALAGGLPASDARVLSVSLSGAPISKAQLGVLRARTGHVTSVQLSPRHGATETPSGITRTVVEADLPALLRGAGPALEGAHHAVMIDRVSDVVPDEVLRALLAWARPQLHPDGLLLVGHAIPSDDTAMLDHLLRWPSLPRRSSAVVALLPRGGVHHIQAPLDDEAAGLVTWRPQP